MHVVLCFFFLLLFFLLSVYCEGVSQRITELSWDYILTRRWTSWHLAGDCGFMDFVSFHQFLLFMFLDTSFDSGGELMRGLLATDGKAVQFFPPFFQ